MTFDIALHEVCVRAGVRYVITKSSRMDSLPNFLTHGAPLGARESSATKYMYTLTTHSDHIIFFWEVENNLRLTKLFRNEQGTLLNKVKKLITASPKITTYPLLTQLHPIWLTICLCWLYSLQLQALLALGLLATKDCSVNESVYTCCCLDSYFHPLHY